MAKQILRNVNIQPEVYDVIQAEAVRRRNGGKGFSLTLNQIVMEWLDGHNAGILPIDTRSLQEMPAVRKVSDVPEVSDEPEEKNVSGETGKTEIRFSGKGDEIGEFFKEE